MSIEVKVPVLPESVADATIAAWHKQPGDYVAAEENLVDLETDKVVLEVPAPSAGVIKEILRSEGDTVEAQELIAILEQGEGAAPTPEAPKAAESAAPAATAPQTELPEMGPAVRRLIAEKGLDARSITASGRGGRLTKEDVLAHLAQGSAPVAAAPAAAPQAAPELAPVSVPAPSDANTPGLAPIPLVNNEEGRPEKRVPMTRLRKRVAERLIQAQHNNAILTTFNEVDLQPVMKIRAQYKDAFTQAHDAKLGFMSFFVKAAVEGLKRFPEINASIDGDDVVYHGYYDVGVAVSSDRGLVVPVLRDADLLNLAQIEKGINEFGSKAAEGTLSLEEMTGGTFTISNGGVFGSMMSTPIINPPQSAILGMHKIQDRAVVVDGEIVVRPMMYVALSYDHRLIDGREAVQFLTTVKSMVEDPVRLLLDV